MEYAMPTDVNVAEKLKQLKTLQSTFIKDVRAAEQKVGEVESDIQELVETTIRALFEDDELNVVYISNGWACESPNENPFPLCVYDGTEDPCLDQCIFCSQPEERK